MYLINFSPFHLHYRPLPLPLTHTLLFAEPPPTFLSFCLWAYLPQYGGKAMYLWITTEESDISPLTSIVNSLFGRVGSNGCFTH